MAVEGRFLPLKMPTLTCWNSVTINDIGLKFGDFLYTIDIFMCINNWQILRGWVSDSERGLIL